MLLHHNCLCLATLTSCSLRTAAAAAIPEATLKEEPDVEAVALRRAGRGTCWLGSSKHLLFFNF